MNWNVLEAIAGKTGLKIDFGGGISTAKDLQIVFDSGASLATVGSIAVRNEDLLREWVLHYGPVKFLLGADVRNEKISISGWTVDTEIWIYDFIKKYLDAGIRPHTQFEFLSRHPEPRHRDDSCVSKIYDGPLNAHVRHSGREPPDGAWLPVLRG